MISLDTSTTKSGYAYFCNGELTEKGVIDCSKESNAETRMQQMCHGLIDLLKTHKPGIVVVEKPPYINSPKTLIQLCEIVGCCRGWAMTQNSCEFVEYMPNEWRSLIKEKDEKIPRNRSECKKWDIEKAHGIIRKGEKIADDNEADAILIGIARIKEFED